MYEPLAGEFSLSKAYNEAASMTVSCSGHPLSVLRPTLAAKGAVTARDLRHIPSGQRVVVTGILVIVHTPPTRSGKRVMFITMEDETGIIDLVLFPKAQAHAARPMRFESLTASYSYWSESASISACGQVRRTSD